MIEIVKCCEWSFITTKDTKIMKVGITIAETFVSFVPSW